MLMVHTPSSARLKLNSVLALLLNKTLMPLLLDHLVLSTVMVLILSLMPLLLLTSSWMDPPVRYGLMAPLPRSVPSALLLDHPELYMLMVHTPSSAKLKLNSVLALLLNRMLMPLLLDPLVLSTGMVLILSLMPLLLVMSSWMDHPDRFGLMDPLHRSVPSALLLDHPELYMLMVHSPSSATLKLNSE